MRAQMGRRVASHSRSVLLRVRRLSKRAGTTSAASWRRSHITASGRAGRASTAPMSSVITSVAICAAYGPPSARIARTSPVARLGRVDSSESTKPECTQCCSACKHKSRRLFEAAQPSR